MTQDFWIDEGLDLQLFADEEYGEVDSDEVSYDEEGSDEAILEDDDETPNEDDVQEDEEEEMLPKSHVQRSISRRVNEVTEKFEPYRRVVEQLQNATGLTLEQIEQYIAQSVGQGQGSAGMQGNMGVGDSRYDELSRTAQAAGKVAIEAQRAVEEQTLKTNPLYADYDDVKDDVRSYADKYGVSLEQAYWAVNGISRAERLQKEAEKRAIERIRKRGGLSAEGDSHQEIKRLGLTKEEIALAQGIGMDPKQYAAMKKIQTLDQFEKISKK